ncbi:hypothetical protein NKH47_16215 [Mesorhizobium sp. M1060]|uniref:hypothetical protein n=1 Tax=unclassified Mesorhizobium TaxID=325217 RepID=UPI0003CEA20E|nr:MULTISPECIES: hypothetical protein [unclassified Mesorhizobium]ESX18708.1 hypothetical protein X766_13455 [Mesorhizobium sp. LSJC255A00]ESX34500.1 hypothetical protein X763_21825 [Mesorhizobium sp. LSHC432A00]ESZ03457.1 hypothetical protein X736_26085 [Mesorhizobium sp. L2C089B000]WJI46025.1 hypothetical protein NL532_05070 [Mesorhizobium sp. C120A]WJI49115.1 hypothetical protein NLY44_20940 [Mesorhizobium sp. C089B]
MQDDTRRRLAAHKKLVGFGNAALPAIEYELAKIDLGKVSHREVSTVVAGLATALHDINEDASRRYISDSLAGPITPLMRAALRSIVRFAMDDWLRSSVGDITVLEHGKLDSGLEAARHIGHWLANVPAADLIGISRIYIIPEIPEPEFAGTYLQTVSVIEIVWRRPSKHWIGNAFRRFMIEKTLYHEIGHHALQHVEMGQDPDQEKQADRYAWKMMRRAHPNLWMLTFPLRFLGASERRKNAKELEAV